LTDQSISITEFKSLKPFHRRAPFKPSGFLVYLI